MMGTPLLLGIGVASLLPKNADTKDIFLSDGIYFMNTDEMSVSSSKIQADAGDGAFTLKGTGIDIRPERFDYIDPENGIYRNFKDKIDIDLLNNKYIDPKNGIFIDPESQISAITIDGQLTNVAIPDISFGTRVMVYEGGRNNTGGGNYEREKISREDFIEKFNETPEDSQITAYKVLPNDNRTSMEKQFVISTKEDRQIYSLFKECVNGLEKELNLMIKKNNRSSHLSFNGEYGAHMPKSLRDYTDKTFEEYASGIIEAGMNEQEFNEKFIQLMLDKTKKKYLIEALSLELSKKLKSKEFLDKMKESKDSSSLSIISGLAGKASGGIGIPAIIATVKILSTGLKKADRFDSEKIAKLVKGLDDGK